MDLNESLASVNLRKELAWGRGYKAMSKKDPLALEVFRELIV